MARLRCTIGGEALDATVGAALVVVPAVSDGKTSTFVALYEASPIELSYIVAAVLAACFAEDNGAFIVARGVMLARTAALRDTPSDPA